MLCSIVILSYNQVDYTRQCLESIRAYTKDVTYELIIIDNASNKETVAYLRQQKDIILIENKENKGFAGGCNQGIKIAKGKYVVLLNNDTIVTNRWLSNMAELMETDEAISMVGPLTNSTVGKQMIKVPYGDNMEEMQQFAKTLSEGNEKPWRTLRIVAFCVIIKKELFQEIGLLDENFAVGNYEDDDFNIRALLAHKKSYICKNSFIHHFMNVSFTQNSLPREKIMLENKLKLESKWDLMDWNHHAESNSYMLQTIVKNQSKRLLHIGCGLGSLGLEIKEKLCDCKIIGMEPHVIRRKIADQYLDSVYPLEIEVLKTLEKISFDMIIIECALEILGLELLENIKSFAKKDAIVLLRVFNIKHITTMERLLLGSVGGNLLCATSENFKYYYDENLKSELEEMGYQVMEIVEIKKRLSNKQEELVQDIGKYKEYRDNTEIYNRIYKIKV